MFLLMPLFAFYLYLFFYRKKLYYSEHLIFSIHLHSLAFLILTVWLLCQSFLGFSWFLLCFLPIIMVYLVWTMRVVYQQRMVVILYKSILLGFVYLLTFGFVYLLAVMLSLT